MRRKAANTEACLSRLVRVPRQLIDRVFKGAGRQKRKSGSQIFIVR